MTIIRGERVTQVALLNGSGELLEPKEQEFVDLVEEECHKAFQKGQEKGEKIGYQRGLEESGALLDLLQTMTRKVLEQKDRLLDQLKPEIIEFAISVCERVIRKELSQPQNLVSLISTLLHAATAGQSDEAVRIVLASEDLALVEQSFDVMERVSLVGDPLMLRGDCRIEMSSGLLNYEIARELSDLQAKVLQR